MTALNAADISTPKQLATLIQDRSDKEIVEAVTAIGVDAALDKVFEGMKGQFLPKKAAGQTAVIQWDIQVDGKGHRYHVIVTNGDISVKAGSAETSRVTLTLALPGLSPAGHRQAERSAGVLLGQAQARGRHDVRHDAAGLVRHELRRLSSGPGGFWVVEPLLKARKKA